MFFSSKFALLLCLFGMGACCFQVAAADIVATDDLSYADGTLFGANGGTGWAAIWTGLGMAVSRGQAESDKIVISNRADGVGIRSSAVPEPASLGVLVMGLTCVGAKRFLRRRHLNSSSISNY